MLKDLFFLPVFNYHLLHARHCTLQIQGVKGLGKFPGFDGDYSLVD